MLLLRFLFIHSIQYLQVSHEPVNGAVNAQTDAHKQDGHEEHQNLVLSHQKGLSALVDKGGTRGYIEAPVRGVCG